MIIINIAQEFTETPGSRYRQDGNHSGEEFRETFLENHFAKNTSSAEKIQIILDGAEGYATSFLEEAFGGLARKYGKEVVKKRLSFISKENPTLIKEIEYYIENSDATA